MIELVVGIMRHGLEFFSIGMWLKKCEFPRYITLYLGVLCTFLWSETPNLLIVISRWDDLAKQEAGMDMVVPVIEQICKW